MQFIYKVAVAWQMENTQGNSWYKRKDSKSKNKYSGGLVSEGVKILNEKIWYMRLKKAVQGSFLQNKELCTKFLLFSRWLKNVYIHVRKIVLNVLI